LDGWHMHAARSVQRGECRRAQMAARTRAGPVLPMPLREPPAGLNC